MAQPARQRGRTYTWDDYQTWPDDERWEIIDGEAVMMSPSPAYRHQRVLAQLVRRLGDFFDGRPCEVLPAPMDVKLSDTDVVEPDILVVCDPGIIEPTHIAGPPTLVVEILSPSSAVHDRLRKLHLYARFGIAEYWIVTPFPSLVEVLVLREEAYGIADVYGRNGVLASVEFPELRIDLSDVFSFPLTPEEEAVYEVREPPPRYRKDSGTHAP